MIHSIVSQLVLGILIAICVFAFAKGGPAERWGSTLVCLSWVCEYSTSLLLRALFSPHLQELTLLATDAALAVGLLVLALRFAKTWLGVAMLMQSAELALHGAAMADWGLQFHQYILFNNVINLGIILLLGGATATAWIQRAKAKQMSRATIQKPSGWLTEANRLAKPPSSEPDSVVN